jgi:hypothetical protein
MCSEGQEQRRVASLYLFLGRRRQFLTTKPIQEAHYPQRTILSSIPYNLSYLRTIPLSFQMLTARPTPILIYVRILHLIHLQLASLLAN